MVMHEQNTQSSFDFALPTMTRNRQDLAKRTCFLPFCREQRALDQCLDMQAWLPQQSYLPFGSPRPPELLPGTLYNVDHSTRISDEVISAACRAAERNRHLPVRAAVRSRRSGRDAAAQGYRTRRELRPRVAAADVCARVTIVAREFVLIRNRASDGACDHIGRWPLQARA
jgi:2'-5' RNA ligase